MGLLKRFITACVFALLGVACATPAFPTPLPTATPFVFPSPLPTATPAPTATPIALPSPIPTATPQVNRLSNAVTNCYSCADCDTDRVAQSSSNSHAAVSCLSHSGTNGYPYRASNPTSDCHSDSVSNALTHSNARCN